MKMTPSTLIWGSLFVYWASISLMVVLPALTWNEEPSDIWRAMTETEKEGHALYVKNGCSYCHSLYVRNIDWGHGAERIAQGGDYAGQEPAILGSERTGPDLSEEGGIRSDDWHIAHFTNPRNTSPLSVMPSWEFLGDKNISRLTSYVQYLIGKRADEKAARQNYWKKRTVSAYESGSDSNIEWMHSMVPKGWRILPNPYPATDYSVLRGKRIFQDYCIGCHGPVGDGQGNAAKYLYPVPLNFTLLRRNLIEGKYIGGILYYQIMNGITGTAMPNFKGILESEKIWDTSNYIAVYFIGYTDSDIAPRGIDASLEETDWKNQYQTPEEYNAKLKDNINVK